MTFATSALNVFYRDVNPVVQIALQLWLYLTPVAYPLSAVPEQYRPFFLLNPLTGIVEGLRAVAGVRPRAGLGRGRHFGGAERDASSSPRSMLFKRTDKYLRGRDLRSLCDGIAIQLDASPSDIAPAVRARSSIWSRRASSAARPDGDEVHSATPRHAWTPRFTRCSDVSFEVPQGAGLGIIGRNGAGKTTLLKLISRVTWPTSGTVRVAGPRRVAHRAGRGLSSRADRPRERLPRRRACSA